MYIVSDFVFVFLFTEPFPVPAGKHEECPFD